MPPTRTASAPRTSAHLTEQELAATSLSLLGQPAVWADLRLPPTSAAAATAAPWTAYWTVRLDTSLDVLEARALLTAAFVSFNAAAQREGALLCVAAIIEGFYIDEGSLEAMDPWLDALQRWLPQSGAWPSIEIEARIMACGVGIILRDQTHPLLAPWADRGGTLVRLIKPGPCRVKLASFLAQYHLWRGEFRRTELIVDALPGLDLTGLLPAEALLWHETVASHARYAAEFDRGAKAVHSALQLVRQHGLRQHRYALHAYGASLALAAGDVDLAERHIEAMRPVLDQDAQADQTHYWHYLTGLRLLRGEVPQAVELARATLANSNEIGGAYRLATHRLSLGQCLLCADEPAQALPELELALAAARQISAGLLAFTAALMRAACLLKLPNAATAWVAVHEAWAEGARQDYRVTAVWWLPEVVAQTAQAALQTMAADDPTAGFVRRFVTRHRLPSPDPLLQSWPWSLILHSFGELEILRHGRPLDRAAGASSKSAQRPIDLLRVLLAHGASPMPVATVMQWLWPEADAAAQRKSFDVALLRLRRLLDDPTLLRLEGSRLWLDDRWVWSDIVALQTLLQRIGSAHGAGLAELQRWAEQLLSLMRGPFLAGEDADWARAARERYRQRFVVTISTLADRIEAHDPDAAIRLFDRALDIEPIAESLSRRLMRLHARRGDHADALRVWRACCTMLSLSTGLQPSRETQELAAQLGLPAFRDPLRPHLKLA
jgi:DNA-binding SARP family transcriptional activator